MFKLIPRENVSPVFSVLGPLFSIGFTMLIGGILFYFLGVDPFAAIKMIFWDPLMSETFSTYSIPQIFIKGAPLILIALGLSICLLYTSPSPRDKRQSRMPSSA